MDATVEIRPSQASRNAYKRQWRRENPDKDREYKFRARYGITLDQYNQMVADQKGLCLICEKPETSLTRWGSVRPLSVDHCHETGKVRGLLCHSCNRVLGLLKDDLALLRSAVNYLEERG